jgi:hypothetical protein
MNPESTDSKAPMVPQANESVSWRQIILSFRLADALSWLWWRQTVG